MIDSPRDVFNVCKICRNQRWADNLLQINRPAENILDHILLGAQKATS